jgi:serine phosphatase RsbU (regulator of sigma subunit)
VSARHPDQGDDVLGELIERSHLVQPDTLPALVAAAAARLGAQEVQVLLVDHAQDLLVPLGPAGPGADGGAAVDTTVAGRAFRHVRVQDVPAGDGLRRLWLPMLDGADRVGVLGVTVRGPDDGARARLLRLASLLAHLIQSKSAVGDALARTARRRPMGLAAELQWSLVPPLTVGTERVVVSAMLEPAYDVGGDLVDYAINGDVAHVAVFDAMGHGLQASLLAALAVGVYRNARRAGHGLAAIAAQIDQAVGSQFGDDSFVTALLCELDLVGGLLRWVNAAHPPPLLIRSGHVVKTLDAPAGPPLGPRLTPRVRVHEEALQPGDRLLAYTDGVIEARDEAGEPFGLDRLGDFVLRAEAAGEPVPETMRRLSKAVLAHQHEALHDDATHVLVGWLTDDPGRIVPERR